MIGLRFRRSPRDDCESLFEVTLAVGESAFNLPAQEEKMR